MCFHLKKLQWLQSQVLQLSFIFISNFIFVCLIFVFLIVCLFIFDYFGLSIHPIHLCPAVEMISQLEEKFIYFFAISNQSEWFLNPTIIIWSLNDLYTVPNEALLSDAKEEPFFGSPKNLSVNRS